MKLEKSLRCQKLRADFHVFYMRNDALNEVSGLHGKRPEGRVRYDRQTLAWNNKHI